MAAKIQKSSELAMFWINNCKKNGKDLEGNEKMLTFATCYLNWTMNGL
jgi:hypothetical protein